jgi:hypothetical protein
VGKIALTAIVQVVSINLNKRKIEGFLGDRAPEESLSTRTE